MLLFITWNLVLFHLMLNFNTSHVTVYLRATDRKRVLLTFQYISCYCLSLLQLLLPNSPLNFNTSHVTVYPFASVSAAIQPVFQYISCYCLSFCGKLFWKIYDISIHLMLLFIECRNCAYMRDLGFQYISCYCLSWRPVRSELSWWISIHLMLLFIKYSHPYRN